MNVKLSILDDCFEFGRHNSFEFNGGNVLGSIMFNGFECDEGTGVFKMNMSSSVWEENSLRRRWLNSRLVYYSNYSVSSSLLTSTSSLD